MSAEDEQDLAGDLQGLLDDLNKRPEKKTAKKSPGRPKKKADPQPQPEPEPEPVVEDDPQPVEPVVDSDPEPEPEVAERLKDPAPAEARRSTVTAEELAEIRAQVKAEILAEFQAEREKTESDREERMLRAIDAKHKGSREEGAPTNPFEQPKVEDPSQLPELVHFVVDGLTVNGKVAYQGQEYRPKDVDVWALLSDRDQIRKWGEVKFRPGPWDGDDFDLDDPTLTADDKKRLQAAMADRTSRLLRA